MNPRKKWRPPTLPASARGAATADVARETEEQKKGTWRDLFESFVVALILAFLFKTFVIEAFVIPTGSMAPTLRGVHMEIRNDQGYISPVGAYRRPDDSLLPIWSATVPYYDRAVPIQQDIDSPGNAVSPYMYSGDRILVSKTSYLFADPARWDVVVFKCPIEASRNYIKRCVGVAGDQIRISRGNIHVRHGDETDFTIARKPSHRMRAMMQPVYDTDYTSPALRELGFVQWVPDAPGDWTSEDGRQYALDSAGDEPAWLRYQHLVPTWAQWDAIQREQRPTDLRPRLITDFCPYNAGEVRRPGYPLRPEQMGAHWVGDLMVEADLTIDSVSGDEPQAIVELILAGRPYQAVIDLKTGHATLTTDGQELARTVDATSVTGPGEYTLGLSNVDHQLRLWVNRSVVEFDGETTYSRPTPLVPTAADLKPAGIALRGATGEVSHLVMTRDVYYIDAENPERPMYVRGGRRETDFLDYPFGDPEHAYDAEKADLASEAARERRLAAWADFYASPDRWEGVFTDGLSQRTFPPLADDEFLMFGDNSPSSSDGRMWGQRFAVNRRLLIGKAVFIYWPHPWEPPAPWHVQGPGGIRIPFYPDFSRMQFIR